jgi:hypothetical protein
MELARRKALLMNGSGPEMTGFSDSNAIPRWFSQEPDHSLRKGQIKGRPVKERHGKERLIKGPDLAAAPIRVGNNNDRIYTAQLNMGTYLCFL